jgi:hypothetical protein
MSHPVAIPLHHADPATQPRVARALIALSVGLATAWIAGTMAIHPHFTSDFHFWHLATRRWLEGINPYSLRPGMAGWPLDDPIFYPLPALIFTIPVAWMPASIAAALFVGIPAALLAWRLTREALWPLLLLTSPAFLAAVTTGQWSPWLVLAVLWPAFGVALAAKPTLGLACWIGRPSRGAAVGALALGVASLVLMPDWPARWLANLNEVVAHPAPIMIPWLGWPLALAALRWRSADARLVLALACVPQLLLFSDQFPLLLVARTRREALALLLANWLSFALWWHRYFPHAGSPLLAQPYVLIGWYLPALFLVLRRPAERQPGPPIDLSRA